VVIVMLFGKNPEAGAVSGDPEETMTMEYPPPRRR